MQYGRNSAPNFSRIVAVTSISQRIPKPCSLSEDLALSIAASNGSAVATALPYGIDINDFVSIIELFSSLLKS
jgi:hypothetical protein